MPIDSKPLHTKLTGSAASILPVTASGVGYDLTTGNYIYYNPNLDIWVQAPSTTSTGSSGVGTGTIAGLFLTETSSSVTIAVNTYTEVLRLPFTVNSSGSFVKLTFTAGYGKTTTATVFAQALLDGTIITSSAGQPAAARKSSTNGFAETIMMATVFTASVGTHTASLQMKTDAGSFTIASAYGDGTQDWGRLILEVVTTGSSGSVAGSTTLQSSSIGYGDQTNLLTGSLNFRYDDNRNRVVIASSAGSGTLYIGTSSSANFGSNPGMGLAYGGVIQSLPSNGASFKNLITWQNFNGDADTVVVGDFSANQILAYNGGSALLLSGSGNILSSSRNIFSGSGLFVHGLSGSHQRLYDGTPAFVAGPNITITTQSNGAIAISASGGSGGSGAVTSSIGSWATYISSSTGTLSNTSYAELLNLIFYVTNSNAPLDINVNLNPSKPTNTGNVYWQLKIDGATITSSFGNNAIAGQVSINSGFVGFLGGQYRLTSALAGWHTASLEMRCNTTGYSFDATNTEPYGGSLTITELKPIGTGSGGSGTGAATNTTRLKIGSYKLSLLTTADDCGAAYFVPAEHLTTNGVLRAIVSTATSSNSIYVQLFNVTSQSYVHIGGPGITTIVTNSTAPTLLTSSNLLTATNFNTSLASIYELQIYGSGSGGNSPTSVLYGAELVFT